MGKFAGLVKFTGKTGDIVGAKGTKGDYIAKAYQPTVKNPQTVGQLTTRVKFLSATGLAKMFMDANGFANIAKSRRVSEFNVMTSKFFKQDSLITFTTTPTDMNATSNIEWPALIISEGELVYPNFNNPSFVEEAEVDVTWDTTGLGATDMIRIVVVQPDSSQVVQDVFAGDAGDGKVAVPEVWSGLRVNVYGFRQGVDSATTRATYTSLFNNNNVAAKATRRQINTNSVYSPSVYIGNGTVA